MGLSRTRYMNCKVGMYQNVVRQMLICLTFDQSDT